jgi:murein DD-endopeptidase MepM/ murein hydrolase activator NlpD
MPVRPRASWGALLLVAGAWLVTPSLAAAQRDAELAISLRARSFRPGEVVVATMTAPAATTWVEVRAFDRDVPAHRLPSGEWRALVGIDLDVAPGPYEITVRSAGGVVTRALQVASRTFAVRKLTVNPDFVNPPAGLQTRLEEEARLVARVYAAATPEPLWVQPFRRPVPHQANSRFGTRSVFNGEPRSPHAGTDFLSPAGTPVRAPNAGRVVIARELYFAGHSVVLDHGAGVFSQLAHLSRIDVREGETVVPGQVVGLVGATGRVTGAHLHWAVRVAGARVDGLSLLAALGPPPRSAQ